MPVHLLRRLVVPSEMVLTTHQPVFLLVLSGAPSITWQHHTIRLDQGCVFASDARHPAVLRCDEERRAEVLCLWPDPSALHPRYGVAGDARVLTMVHEPNDAVAATMQALAGTLAGSSARRVEDQGVLRNWLSQLLRAQQSLQPAIDLCQGRTPERRCELFLRLARARALLLASGCGDEIVECARVAHLSTSHFVRMFRRVFGESPHRYRHIARMERARQLLLSTSLPIGEITRQVGFENLASFSRAFRQHFGSSAREMRARNEGRATSQRGAEPALGTKRVPRERCAVVHLDVARAT